MFKKFVGLIVVVLFVGTANTSAATTDSDLTAAGTTTTSAENEDDYLVTATSEENLDGAQIATADVIVDVGTANQNNSSSDVSFQTANAGNIANSAAGNNVENWKAKVNDAINKQANQFSNLNNSILSSR